MEDTELGIEKFKKKYLAFIGALYEMRYKGIKVRRLQNIKLFDRDWEFEILPFKFR